MQFADTMRQRHQAVISTQYPSDSEQLNKQLNSRHCASPRTIFALCLVFRIANALLVQTYFNPDEHWQALEVAHRVVFGYNKFHLVFAFQSCDDCEQMCFFFYKKCFMLVYRYGHLTWEWKRGIRSYMHPFLFALLYKVLAFLGLDTPLFMV